ncbi:MAG: methyltransferase domain-containing protein, partial [Acidobacteriota bacterium]|nr:methyltransferase domain-containing protein [Acidobacteriota bacterium]
MLEFTGERIVPGLADQNLWNEHRSRYAFARQFALGRRVLDAGCGTGYGAAELAMHAREVTGVDCSQEAVEYAREHYARENLKFQQGWCRQLPAADASVDLVVAFEVIEHLSESREFLTEARRVLTKNGLFLVSTPNKLYYGESREEAGPNPFHVHEFEYAEFRDELARVFDDVSMLAQNHGECIVFRPLGLHVDESAMLDVAEQRLDGDAAHFLLAVCGVGHVPRLQPFVYEPGAANILREREHHIKKLQGELRLKSDWLEEERFKLAERNREHSALVGMFAAQNVELEARNRWAQESQREAQDRGARVVELQEELERARRAFEIAVEGYEAKIAGLEREIGETVERAVDTERRLTSELASTVDELGRCVDLLHTAEATIDERTAWAHSVQAQADERLARLRIARDSKWMKLGRKLGLGPV